ncbi:MAG TPA: site-specific integrase [Bryobacteraceae bacterium]|nr:site-specific integrase [Bryobacteraceae bacterium]
MLTIFRRHLAKCPHRNKGRQHRRCSCPIHTEGNIGLNQTPVRKALNLTNWDAATVLVHKWEAQGYIDLDQNPGLAEATKPDGKTVAAAARAYLENCVARRISQPSVRKFEILLSAMDAHLAKQGITQIADVKPEHMDGFFNSWNWSPRTAQKQVERLRAIWRFVYRRRWVAFDPALDIKAPVVPPKEVDPLSEDEIEKILREASRHPRHYALVLLLLHTGLRIADAVLLRKDRVSNGRILLYTAKNKKPVHLPLPENLVSALDKLETPSRQFYFWRGEGKKQTAVNNWRDTLDGLFKRAGVERAHPHLFRHTLATELLSKGVEIEDVAAILGNTSAIVARHYAQWSTSRQSRLDEAVKKTWGQSKPKLVRVR